MNKINDYNNNMGHVDISYQLQNEYRFNRWIRNCKWWWWSLLFWALGVMLVNAYVIYSIVNITEGTPKKDLLSHHNFRKSIAMNWINTDRDYCQDQGSTTSSKRKRKTASSLSSLLVSTLESDSTKINRHFEVKLWKKQRATAITDKNIIGILIKRLDTTLDYFTRPTKENIRCGLHKWVGMETEINIGYFPSCIFNLCIACYSSFHSVTYLVKDENKLKLKYKT